MFSLRCVALLSAGVASESYHAYQRRNSVRRYKPTLVADFPRDSGTSSQVKNGSFHAVGVQETVLWTDLMRNAKARR